MNMVSVHSSLVDYFEELLIESSDLSFMWLVYHACAILYATLLYHAPKF